MTEDTAIEHAFEAAYSKHARPEYPLSRQVEFITFCGVLRVDFTVRFGDQVIGFECDGKEFHDVFRDEVRDAVLLGERHLAIIYHFGGAELFYAPEVALQFVLAHDPSLFYDRTAVVLRRPIEVSEFRSLPHLIRHSDPSLASGRQHWPYIYRRMRELGITSIDDYVLEPQ